ncbi:MAG TPA: SCO family protein [Polyangiaceae bacterium]|nr:SCO family protein [Polyangiaceae bacterium]
MVSSFLRHGASALVAASLAFTSVAAADPVQAPDHTEEAPKRLKGVDVIEHLGERVPEGLAFVDQDGKSVTIADYLHAGVPVILTFNYSSCPMLCSLQLTAFVEGLKKLDFTAGKQFRIVTVLLDPNETGESARRFRSRYLAQYNRPGSEPGWNFLRGSDANIHALAKAVGFSYNYNEARGEYVHPAALTLLSPEGKVARYLYGLEYPDKTLHLGLVEASEGRVGSSLDRLVLYCFHYDSSEGRYAPIANRIMQVGGAVSLVGLAAFLTILIRRDKKRTLVESTAQ